MRERKGEKMSAIVPLYKDVNTNMEEATDSEPYPGHIYMDSVSFGTGQCCL
jgi:hypothetical protein